MKLLLRTLLVLSALLKITQAACNACDSNDTETLMATTTTVTFRSIPNCNLSIGNLTYENGSITGLNPGSVYQISLGCLNCCKNVTTEPDAVRDITVTKFTTSSMSLNWTRPNGEISFYRVQWNDGSSNQTVDQNHSNITDLTAGVRYEITVTAVAGDGHTEGQNDTVSQYTKPEAVRDLTVTKFTTSSMSLNWPKPNGEISFYRVQWNDGNSNQTVNVTLHHTNITGLTAGVQYVITVTAVAGDGHTEGLSDTVSQYTKPAVVRNLNVTKVTTSSVSLEWSIPNGSATSYTVEWTDGNATTTTTNFTINDLVPGVQYNITVAAVAGESSNRGETTLRTTFTRPEKPGNIMITNRGTDNLNISWILPKGRVDHYLVTISNEDLMFLNTQNTTVTTAHFTDLNPGRIFNITVTAVVGDFNDMSDQSSFATIPTPPGFIIFSRTKNSSLYLEWATPAKMEDAPHITYNITYQTDNGALQSLNASVNNTELSMLSSGTSYSITVETVGPEYLTSSNVSTSAFTLPNPVSDIIASPKSNTSIEVKWSYPQGKQLYYRYLVQTYKDTGEPLNTTVNSNITDVLNLEPGTRYNISVRTIAAPGSESTDEHTFSYTMPEAVTNLKVVNVTTTAIQLMWQRQSDHKPSYSYLVVALQGAKEVQNNSSETETYTFSDLTPGNAYTFRVFTVVEGVKSTAEDTFSYTRPEAVPDIIAIGSTTTLAVSWTSPVGQVLSYTVLLNRDGQLVGNQTDLSNNTLNTQFTGLKPGVLYCSTVVTKSGTFENNSSCVYNATFPNPPGPIMVDSQNVDSINFTWPFPEDMDNIEYNFSVNRVSLIENNWFLLENLTSGNLYCISVATVGVRNYQSTPVTTCNYTRPHSVTDLRQTEITTNAVTLVWEQRESRPNYTYVVQASSVFLSEAVFNTTVNVTGLLPGSNYSFTVTTQTADGTLAAPVTVSYFTRPNSVISLGAETLNTTDVLLSWNLIPEEQNNTYRVETAGCGSKNETMVSKSTQISELTPGTRCTFCVYARAGDGIEGEPNCTSQYTKPEKVHPSIFNQGSNSSILVSWTKPPGGVESYKVYLNSNFQDLNQTEQDFLFENLFAGRLYTAMVTTFSGPFNASSAPITNATFPNPPGPIEILTKKTTSIAIKWQEAPLMTNASFHYQLTYIPSQDGGYVNATNTSHTFDSLLSGTPYNISVATVGVMGFKSEEVQIHMVTTRPFSVKSLNASTEEENITFRWHEPEKYKEGYRYNLTLQDEPVSTITEKLEYNIDGLVPGRRYNLSVTTETSDGTQGDPRWISSCTNASPVKNFQCKSPNKPNAEVLLSWSAPAGYNSGFKTIVDYDQIITLTNNTNQTVSSLRHHTEYILTVVTLGCGKESTPVTLSCRTGITNPPVPVDHDYVNLTEREYTTFSVLIEPGLLNNTNGPITHVGVLGPVSGNTSDFRNHLGKTYEQWKAKETTVYLATVRENVLQSRSGQSGLTIEVGDESIWEGYTNGPLSAGEKYQYAIVLFTSLNLENTSLVDSERSLVSVTISYFNVELLKNPAVVVVGIAVGATLGIFLVLFVILVGFIVYWKRVSNKESSDIQIHSMRAKVSVAVRVEDYEAYYKKQKADSNCGFAEEFEDLKVVGTGQAKTNALTVENKPKNRYNNVLPYDSSRVKLSIIHGSPHDDYINANYMPGYNSRKEYIAAQGPLPTTVSEFWRMIWEKNVQTLVMLTRCNEQGRVKCEQYWDYGTKHYENITVTTTSEIPLEDWTIRDFDVKNVKTAETRSVRHFHFTAWPDHGVPETTELLISFRHLVREHMDQYSRHSPTVVHCSAGVGRTGTFIAIDRLIFQIERENIVDVYGIVHDLRMHRPLMVQTEDQYVFLNQCSMDIIRSRTGTNVDLIYQNTAALSIYENVELKKGFPKNGHHNA